MTRKTSDLRKISEGRTSKDPKHGQNVNFIKKRYEAIGKKAPPTSNMSNAIRFTRAEFIKAIKKHNEDLLKDLTDDQLESLDLEYLDDLMKKNNIKIEKTRKADWRKAEKDIADGFRELLRDDFFSYQDRSGKICKVDLAKIGVEEVGGARESDVKVFRNDNEKIAIYIESKLDFMSAEYFKFKLAIRDKKLSYDHEFFLNGLDDEEKIQMNNLFRSIDINGFLNSILEMKDVKLHWMTFLENIKTVFQNLRVDADFKDLASEVKQIPSSFPGNTDALIKIFDLYCKHYIEKYDSIVYQIYDSYGGNEWMDDVSQFTIDDHSEGRSADNYSMTFYPVDDLMSKFYQWNEIFDDQGEQTYEIDQEKIIGLSDELKSIEVKLNRIMDTAKITDPRDLLKMKNKDKLMYFFKAFISSVGRKTKDGVPVVGLLEDSLGNMQITPEVEIESERLPQMITEYYVKKDRCAYIQIADTVYQFDEKTNVFQIPNLPTMKDFIKKFIVKISISDDVDLISLHIRAVKPQQADMQGMNLVSFKKNDKNYLGK